MNRANADVQVVEIQVEENDVTPLTTTELSFVGGGECVVNPH